MNIFIKSVKRLAVPTLLAVLLTLSGCFRMLIPQLPVPPRQEAPPQDVPLPEAPLQAIPPQEDTPAEVPKQELKPIVIAVDYATDELLGQYDSVIYRHAENVGAVRILLVTNETAKDFKLIAVDFREYGDTIACFEGETILSLDELTPETPLVASAEFPGLFTTRGISFLDETGQKRCFYVGMSGMDGSLFLAEFVSPDS